MGHGSPAKTRSLLTKAARKGDAFFVRVSQEEERGGVTVGL